MRYKKKIGNSGEDFAVRLLEDSGYIIVERNFWTKVGEIDIIARREGMLHFIEVKTRTQTDYGYPAESVTEEKQERIRKVAEIYMFQRRLYWKNVSFDVIEITANMIMNCI